VHSRDSDLSILTLVVQHVAPVHVLRDILDEVDGLSLSRCREIGLTVVEVEPEVLLTVTALPRRLSRGDRLSFHVCRENDWICLTNDRPLRRICEEHGVRAQWGLELMAELVSAGALSRSRALGTARRIRENNPHHISEAIVKRFAARLGRVE